MSTVCRLVNGLHGGMVAGNGLGLCDGGVFEFRLPELLLGFVLLLMFTYFCLALFVKPKLKFNRITVADAYNFKPHYCKTPC